MSEATILVNPRSFAPPSHVLHRLDGSTITRDEAETFARTTLQMARVTGAQLVLIDQGKVVWTAAFGLRQREPPLPMQRTTTTWAASITKSVFATYVMQLVERGAFALDTPVARQLSAPLDTFEPYRDRASLLVQDPAWLRVTPRMLLSHSSGLLNFAFLEPDQKLRLHFPPGARYQYSGEGINLLQFLVEQQQKRPLEQLMHDALFAPLGMTRSSLIYREEFAADVADRYGTDEQFLAHTRRFPARAAGSMTTSAEDLGRFFEALLAGRVLRGATRKAMLTPVVRIRSQHQFPLQPNETDGSEAEKVGLAYGIGWGLLTHTRFGPAFFKEGHGDGAQTYAIVFERRKAGMILLTNSDNGEITFRPLLETLLGNTETPWEWEGYTPGFIAQSRRYQ